MSARSSSRPSADEKDRAAAGGPGEAAASGFEERLHELEAAVHELEGEELTLEQAIECYRRGVEHLRACRELLDAAEARLVELVQAEGGVVERPLTVTESGLEGAEDEGV